MNLKKLLINKLENHIKNSNTFEYWLENDFLNVFISTSGTATNFIVTLSENQLKNWNMTAFDVRNYIEKEGFTTNELFLTPSKNNKNEFEVNLAGLKDLSKNLILASDT